MKKPLTALLTLLLVAGVGYGIYRSAGTQLNERQTVTVRGLIGSEKESFFRDPEVVAALKAQRLNVVVEKRGSRQIALSPDLKNYDFAFPAGVPSAEKLRREQKVGNTYDVFYTPLAVATWQPIVKVLESNGAARAQGSGASGTLDMGAFLGLVGADKRWRDLKNNAAYPVGRSVLLMSTDVRRSNSAAMYLALASYVLNGEEVVPSESAARALVPKLSALFLRQGYQEASSEGPFEDYLAMGLGKAPLVTVYESQFVEAALNRQLPAGATLIYPEPTVFTKHVLVPFTDGGKRLGEALANDPKLQALATKHGFRTRDAAALPALAKTAGLNLPAQLVNVVDPPAYEVLETMIVGIEGTLAKQARQPGSDERLTQGLAAGATLNGTP